MYRYRTGLSSHSVKQSFCTEFSQSFFFYHQTIWVHSVVLLKNQDFSTKLDQHFFFTDIFYFFVFQKAHFSNTFLKFKIIFKENNLKCSVNSKTEHKNSVKTPCKNSVLRCGRISTVHIFLRIEYLLGSLFWKRSDTPPVRFSKPQVYCLNEQN